MVSVEIVIVGNEVLLGLVQDTNSNYLCRVIRGMGGRVRHIAVVRDEIEAIAAELKASLDRRAGVVFTCGGLGPTDDDLTLTAIAEAAGVKLALDSDAEDFVARRYRELAHEGYVKSAEMSEARLKMARLPQGSRAVENPAGTAPAVVLEARGCRIISLPGIPSELKAVIEGPLQGLLGEVFGRGSYRERELVIDCRDESVLAPALREVAALNPEVYIKSRASHFGRDVMFRVAISASASSPEQAEALIERASESLKRALRVAGIK